MSHVAMEKHICKICGEEYETGAILLHQRLRDIDPKRTVTGAGLCNEHQKMFNEGYLALIEADREKSEILPSGNMTLDGAHRTGRVIFMLRAAADRLFNIEIDKKLPFVYIEPEAYEQIEKLAKESMAQEG